MNDIECSTRESGLISIIVPVYNAEMYLSKCVESIRGQSYSKIELILVDDGSTDGSPEFCDSIAKKDTRVRVIHCQNGGAAVARNKGLDIACGEYLMFVDSDDYIHSDLCKMLLEGMQNNEASCCLCGYEIVNQNGEGKKISSAQSISFSGRDAIQKRYIENREYINIINPWGKLYYWKMWEKLRFTPSLYYEDLDIMPFLYINNKKVVCIPLIGYYYVQRIGSCSNGVGTDDKRYIDSLLIRKKHIEYFKSQKENYLAKSVMKRAVDLIITSDCNGWIPESYMEQSQKLFLSYWKEIKKSRVISKKEKISYSFYRYLGKNFYRMVLNVKKNRIF